MFIAFRFIPGSLVRRPVSRTGLQAALVVLLLVGFVTTVLALPQPQDRRRNYKQLNRQDFEQIHGYSAEKGGATGDAAVTSDRYDMLRYNLAITFDVDQQQVDGIVKMVFSSEVDGLQDVVFDLTNVLTLDSIGHQSGDLMFTHVGDSVSVVLPADLAEGDVDSFSVAYHGRPTPPIINRGLMFKTHHTSQPEISGPIVANMSEPAYAQSWWPCKDRPDDKALSTVTLRVPDDLIAVSNGKLIVDAPSGAGWRSYTWREDYPIATYLISVAISDYVLLQEECTTSLGTEVPLRNWVFPPDVDDATVDFAPLCDMMDFSEGLFGIYPFVGEKYGHAEFIWSGAMEYQTVTSIGQSSIRGDGSRDWLIIHELAHQWFGDSLTPRYWADIWLNEGFATYSEALWYEHLEGEAACRQYLLNMVDIDSWQRQGPVYDPVPVFPGSVIYDKGAWIVHMLRGRLGDELFFEFLTDWTQGDGRPNTTVTTAELVALAGEYAEQDLEPFFTPWLETTETPRLVFSYQADGNQVSVSLSQTQTTLFDNVYPIRVTTAVGSQFRQLHLTERSISQEWTFPDDVLNVELDPESWVLWRLDGNGGPSQGLVSAYPNPSRGAYVHLEFWLETAENVVLSVFDAYGRQITRRDLGTFAIGLQETVWNEKDGEGRPVPSGVYWISLEIGGQRSVRKITVLH